MSHFSETLNLLVRRDEELTGCTLGNEYSGNIGLRVCSIFVILVGSSFGALFPVIARYNPGLGVPSWAFFVAKYFGSGVIVATAFIHLLAPANEALSNPCLSGVITEYPWVQGIALMAVFTLFFVELMAMRYATFSTLSSAMALEATSACTPSIASSTTQIASSSNSPTPSSSHPEKSTDPHHTHHTHSRIAEPEPHLSHIPDHVDPERADPHAESYAAQLTSLFILEFGVIFHSIFIGLTLAVAGAEFKTLYVVLVFHQMFEGFGLGARLASVPWPQSKRWTPYLMAMGFGISTPIAIAIGLGVRNSYDVEGPTTLIVNGVFDSLSAGILLYTGLVELMAHEFLFSHSLKEAGPGTVLLAFAYMVLGAFLMALLGRWA